MPVENYSPNIGRTPEERKRAARTLDHVGELLKQSNGKGLFTPSFPPAGTAEQETIHALINSDSEE
jgi:hypothetical protein